MILITLCLIESEENVAKCQFLSTPSDNRGFVDIFL